MSVALKQPQSCIHFNISKNNNKTFNQFQYRCFNVLANFIQNIQTIISHNLKSLKTISKLCVFAKSIVSTKLSNLSVFFNTAFLCFEVQNYRDNFKCRVIISCC